MTNETEQPIEPESNHTEEKPVRFPELAELEEKIKRRLNRNQRFLERFLDEDYDDLEDDDEIIEEDDEPEQTEEL